MFLGKAAGPNHPPASHSVTIYETLRNHQGFNAMGTDYSAAITTVVALVLVLTGMVTYVLTRPSDLAPRTR
jgi:hypothetical protein